MNRNRKYLLKQNKDLLEEVEQVQNELRRRARAIARGKPITFVNGGFKLEFVGKIEQNEELKEG